MLNRTYKVLIVEDDDNTREQLHTFVNQHPQLIVQGLAASYITAKKLTKSRRYDVALVDLGLPDGDGADLIRQLSDEQPNTKSMVITIMGDRDSVIRAIKAGACGYLLKDGTPSELGDSIMQMVNGGAPVSPAIARYLLDYFRKQETEHESTSRIEKELTSRESEILKLVATGYSYRDIAEVLSLSYHTVSTHMKNIYAKLSVCSRGQAVYQALQSGLIDVNCTTT